MLVAEPASERDLHVAALGADRRRADIVRASFLAKRGLVPLTSRFYFQRYNGAE